jgi:ABC-2 type transport system permease protein
VEYGAFKAMVIKRLIGTWKIIARNNLQNQLLTPSSSILFTIGKLFYFIFTLLSIFAIFNQTTSLQGYSLPQGIIIAIVYSLLESIFGFIFRSLYTFRPILIKGDFDLDLLKPLPAFFRPLFSGPDFLDIPLIIIQFFSLIYFINYYSINISLLTIIITAYYFAISLILAFSIHQFIAAFSILTSEIDSLVMLFRNFSRAGVVPTDIYKSSFAFILNYIVPVTILFTLPAKALVGLTNTSILVYATAYTAIFFLLTFQLWNYSLKKYTSASS